MASRGFKRQPTAVDLFSGCGGVTAGLKRAGFSVVAAVDNDQVACATYSLNHPEVHLYPIDIHEVDPNDILEQDLRGQPLDVLAVCAPCQPFSVQNRRRKPDERERLILQGVRFAEALRPTLIFFENVPGLLADRYRPIVDELRQQLADLGYHVGEPTIVDAADYGVPQRRPRFVLLASTNPLLLRIPPASTPPGKRRTVRDAFRGLKKLGPGESDPDDPLHAARRHKPIAIERLRHVPKNGGSRAAIPEELQLTCHKKHDGHRDVYGRMAWDTVAPTLTTGCTNITRGRFAHPEEDRAITLREAARLQTFDDHYRFATTSHEKIAAQIGNAVPPEFIAHFGRWWLQVLSQELSVV